MRTASRHRISVDLGSLRSALFAQARARGVSPSGLLRSVLGVALGGGEGEGDGVKAATPAITTTRVRLTIRVNADEARQLTLAAQAAGLPLGTFLAGLAAGVPILATGGSRTGLLSALTASTASLSTVSRNLHHLAGLMRQTATEPAHADLSTLDRLHHDLRHHLTLAAAALADLQPGRPQPQLPTPPTA